MKQKKFFLFNPALIGVLAIILFVVSIFLDIVIDKTSRPTYLGPIGLSLYAIAFLLLDFAYTWVFLGKLAHRYPEHKESILDIRKKHCLPIRKNINKLRKMQISIKTIVSHFSDDSCEFQQIDREWRTGLKWITFFIICMLLIYPVELLIADWMEAVRPVILDYLSSIGLVK